ncbi:MAG: putative metal-binding protein (TIGR02443 family) [Cellvibrionaceae bacterium]|jgi:uncharacterized metal-binding protein (TIGR02443 family)
MKIIKRFIAGAVCPRCSQMDKLVTYREDEKDFRECVSCDFIDEMQFKQQPRELETRVNVTETEKLAETQVLTLEPKRNKNKT